MNDLNDEITTGKADKISGGGRYQDGYNYTFDWGVSKCKLLIGFEVVEVCRTSPGRSSARCVLIARRWADLI